MSKGNTFENDLMKFILQAVAIANIGDNAASSPLTNLQVALHTADPGEAGDQTTSEVAYTGYTRVAVARTAGGWTVTNNQGVNAGAVTFGAFTAGSTQQATYFSVGTASSGAGKLLYSGALSNQVTISLGNPVAAFAPGTLVITED